MVKVQIELTEAENKFVAIHKIKNGFVSKAEAVRDIINLRMKGR